jgi:hypothetical protein
VTGPVFEFYLLTGGVGTMTYAKNDEGTRAAKAAGESQRSPTDSKAGGERRPRKRRWRIIVLAVLVFLILLVAAVPWIVSLRFVSDRVISYASNAARGEIRLEKLSATWFGPTTVEGLTVLDPERREVLSLRRLRLAPGIWHLITDHEAFDKLEIESPDLVLYLDQENRVSIAEAFEPVREGVPDEAASSADDLPAFTGSISIAEGRVELARSDGSRYEATDIDGEFDLATLARVDGRVSVKLEGGSRLHCRMSATDLVRGGTIDVDGSSGTFTLEMDGPAQIGPLARIALQRAGLTGVANVKLDARKQPGDVSANFEATVVGFQTEERAAGEASPLDASVTGTLNLKDEVLTAQAELSGTPGTAKADLRYRYSGSPPEVSAEQVASAILGGESLTLPEFTMMVESNIDLAAVDRAVPGSLRMPDGPALTGGRISVSELRVAGGARPEISGVMRVSGLSAQQDGTPTTLEPVSLTVNATLEPGAGLTIERADVTSGFATVNASGTINKLKAQFACDFASVQAQLGKLVGLGTMELDGQLSGTLDANRVDDDRINTALELEARQVRYAAGERSIAVPQTLVKQKGHVELSEKKLARVDVDEFSVDLGGQVVADGAGWFDMSKKGFSASVNLRRADVEYVSQRAAEWGIKDLERFTGNLRGDVSAARGSDSEPIRSSGGLTVEQLAAAGEALFDEDVLMTWSGATFDTRTMRLAVPKGGLKSDVASVDLRGIRVDGDTGTIRQGKLRGSVDAVRVLRAVEIASGQEKPAYIRGKLAFDATISQSREGIKLAGTADVADLEIGSGKNAIREKRGDLQYEATVDTSAHRLVLGPTRLTSTPLSLELSGSIDKYDSAMIASLQGQYDASWKELTALLHQFVPSTGNLVVVEGTSKSNFKVSGPLNKDGVVPPYRNVKAEVSIGWDAASIAGVELKKGTISPKFVNGRLNLQSTAIPTLEGNVRLRATLDTTTPGMTLTIPGKNKVLNGVKVTRELSRDLLSHINPVFYQVAAASGAVDLTVNDLVFPLEESARGKATGDGKLQLTDMLVTPAGLLQKLIALGGNPEAAKMISMVVQGLDFTVANGRISYEDFTLIFPGDFDLKFSGFVGLDDAVDLIVSVPIRPELLERLGVGSDAIRYARRLAGERVEIPILGTRTKPKVLLERINVQELLLKALTDKTEETITDVLGDILEDVKKKNERRRERR